MSRRSLSISKNSNVGRRACRDMPWYLRRQWMPGFVRTSLDGCQNLFTGTQLHGATDQIDVSSFGILLLEQVPSCVQFLDDTLGYQAAQVFRLQPAQRREFLETVTGECIRHSGVTWRSVPAGDWRPRVRKSSEPWPLSHNSHAHHRCAAKTPSHRC